MPSSTDIAAALSGGAAVLAITLSVLATRAWTLSRSRRSLLLAVAFLAAALHAVATAWLLLDEALQADRWVVLPLAHVATLLLIYLALLRG